MKILKTFYAGILIFSMFAYANDETDNTLKKEQELIRLILGTPLIPEARKLINELIEVQPLHLNTQQYLLDLITSDRESVSDRDRNRAHNILRLIGPTLNIEIQEELVRKTIYSPDEPTNKDYIGRIIITELKETLGDILVYLDTKIQNKIVDIATSDQVSESARSRARAVLILGGSKSYEIQEKLVRLATSKRTPELAQSAAKEILIGTVSLLLTDPLYWRGFSTYRTKGPITLHPDIQMKLVRLATSKRTPEFAQSVAKEILIGYTSPLHLSAEKQLIHLATSDQTSETVQKRAADILITIELHSKTQNQLVRQATSTSGSTAQFMSMDILKQNPFPLTLDVQKNLVSLATSSTSSDFTRLTSQHILLIHSPSLHLETLLQLSDVFLAYKNNIGYSMAEDTLIRLQNIGPIIPELINAYINSDRNSGKMQSIKRVLDQHAPFDLDLEIQRELLNIVQFNSKSRYKTLLPVVYVPGNKVSKDHKKAAKEILFSLDIHPDIKSELGIKARCLSAF